MNSKMEDRTSVTIDKNKLIIEGNTVDADFCVEDINVSFANNKKDCMEEVYLKIEIGDFVKLSSLVDLFKWINENSGENWRITLEKLESKDSVSKSSSESISFNEHKWKWSSDILTED